MKLPESGLYGVQKEAIRLSWLKAGFAFFMEMGLGKTRVVLYEFNWLAEEGLVDFLFVVAPKSLLGSWRGEAEELKYPYPVIIVTKKMKPEKLIAEIKKIKGPVVLVINYELLLYNTGAGLLEALMKLGRIYIALDESIRIKSKDSVVGKKLYEMFNGVQGHFKRILSGGPAPQGPHDLWAQFRFIGALPGVAYYAFRNKYCQMGGWMGKQVIGAQNLSILREKTGHAVFRAKKKDWADLPEKLPAITRDVEMLPEQRQAYLGMMHEFVTEWGDTHITVEMAVTAKAKLAQISSGFMFDNDKNVHWLMPFEKNPKLADLDEFLDQVDTKVIVFYHHRPSREALQWLAEKRSNQFECAFLESGMTVDKIESEKARFNKEDNVKVIFCQSSAHKYGHTLLGTEKQPCHTSYFFENTYNLDTRAQSEDRNHRHGQKWPVTYADVAVSREDRLTLKSLQRKERFEEQLLFELTGVGEENAIASVFEDF